MKPKLLEDLHQLLICSLTLHRVRKFLRTSWASYWSADDPSEDGALRDEMTVVEPDDLVLDDFPVTVCSDDDVYASGLVETLVGQLERLQLLVDARRCTERR